MSTLKGVKRLEDVHQLRGVGCHRRGQQANRNHSDAFGDAPGFALRRKSARGYVRDTFEWVTGLRVCRDHNEESKNIRCLCTAIADSTHPPTPVVALRDIIPGRRECGISELGVNRRLTYRLLAHLRSTHISLRVRIGILRKDT